MNYKIKNDFIYLNFKTWLRNNRSRFIVRPYIKRRTRTTFTIGFNGVEIIELLFKKCGGINLFGLNNGKLINCPITDFEIISETKNENGWYEAFTSESPIYYRSRKDLWEKNSYEWILSWANENLNSESSLCYYAHDGGEQIMVLKNILLHKLPKREDLVFIKRVMEPKEKDV